MLHSALLSLLTTTLNLSEVFLDLSQIIIIIIIITNSAAGLRNYTIHPPTTTIKSLFPHPSLKQVSSMDSFLDDLWSSIFTAGPTPTLLVATNATFAVLQILFFLLLIATTSIHFIVLSLLSGSLWWSINWFARELREAQARGEEKSNRFEKGHAIDDGESDTEKADMTKSVEAKGTSSSLLEPPPIPSRKRLLSSFDEGSGYASTDSEWEKVDVREATG